MCRSMPASTTSICSSNGAVGRSIWLLGHIKYGIGESVSTDRGKTWPELKPSQIPHTPSRFFVRRLAR